MRWGFDIEAHDWTVFVLGSAVSEEGHVCRFWKEDDVIDWYTGLPTGDEVIAHNGGGYDFLFLISITPHLSWSASIAGSSIVTCRAKGHALCRDSFRMFPRSLKKWTGGKDDVGLDCECGKNCGGYCAIRPDLPPLKRKRLMQYCIGDSRRLIETWIEDTDRLVAEGLDLFNSRGQMRSTIGSVAWNTAAPMAGLDPNGKINWNDYNTGRRAYYGGRTEVGRTHFDLGYRYDVHAMYPWSLTKPVPVGKRRSYAFKTASKHFSNEKPGLYHAEVWIPDTDLPPLPHRYSETRGHGRLTRDRLLWATGHIRGTWALPELKCAVRHGARIARITMADTWESSEAIFTPYIDFIYGARRKASDAGDDRWAAILKWFANSLTGKLAQRPDIMRLKVIGHWDNPGENWHQLGSKLSRVYAQSTQKVATCAHTHIAAYLTSRARAKLLDRLARHSGRWLYCDTDSTYLCDPDNTDVHPSKLGTWGYEGIASDWKALAPKLYRYRDDEGRGYVRAKGIPKPTWETLDELEAGQKIIRDGGVERIRRNEGEFIRRKVERGYRDNLTSQTANRCGTRFINEDGTTRPIHRTKYGEYK